MKNYTKTIGSLLVITFLMSSCGVMFGGSKYNAIIEVKNHPNAIITANGNKLGSGKVTALLPRNESLNIQISEEGCETKTQTFYKKFRTGNFILSVLSWGLIGLGVDLGTGAAYKPDHINNQEITKLNTKTFLVDIDYSECQK